MSSKPSEKQSKSSSSPATMSDEDKELQEEIATYVKVITTDEEPKLCNDALNHLIDRVRGSTSSMTSIPKPLKFLRPHFSELKERFSNMEKNPESFPATFDDVRKKLADLLSVLSMTYESTSETEGQILRYKLAGHIDSLEEWGHDFLRNLSGEIIVEHQKRTGSKGDGSEMADEVDESDLVRLVEKIAPFYMEHNAEPDACDLLMEMDRPEEIIGLVSGDNADRVQRVCLYVTSCAKYLEEEEAARLKRVALEIRKKAQQWSAAFALALNLRDYEAAKSLFLDCKDPAVRRQLAFMMARQGMPIVTDIAGSATTIGCDDEECQLLDEISNNQRLAGLFSDAVDDLGLRNTPMDPRELTKEKGAGVKQKSGAGGMQNAHENIALTFVNAFANCGFCDDVLLKEDEAWIYKNREIDMLSATASYGLVYLWDVDSISRVDNFLKSSEGYVRAGALLALGVMNATVRSEADVAFGLISDHITSTDSKNSSVIMGGILGLGLAYTSTSREDVADFISTYLESEDGNPAVKATAALAIGLVYCGTADNSVFGKLLENFPNEGEALLTSKYVRYYCLGMGLIYLGTGDKCAIPVEAISVVPERVKRYASLCIETCAFVASGNMVEVQKFLRDASSDIRAMHEKKKQREMEELTKGMDADKKDKKDKKDEEKEEETELPSSGVAVLGVALAAMGEDINDEMVIRMMDHVLQFGNKNTRKAVPLALAVLSVSKPTISIVDTLTRLSHDPNPDVAGSAILSLGLVSSGTHNTRVRSILQGLSDYYKNEPKLVFAVRISQGLLNLGRGALTLSPVHGDRSLMCIPAIAGLLVVLHSCLDVENTLLGDLNCLLYSLSVSIYPRFIITVDDSAEMKKVKIPVHIGQAIDVAGQAGKPRGIAGFQTYTTPAVIGFGERAELATDEYVSLTPFLDGVVVVKKTEIKDDSMKD